ncbi:Degenerate transposase, partial [Streptococcus pneumoniae CCCB]
MTEFSLD